MTYLVRARYCSHAILLVLTDRARFTIHSKGFARHSDNSYKSLRGLSKSTILSPPGEGLRMRAAGFPVSPLLFYPASWGNYAISSLRTSRGAARRLNGEIRTLPQWDVQLPAASRQKSHLKLTVPPSVLKSTLLLDRPSAEVYPSQRRIPNPNIAMVYGELKRLLSAGSKASCRAHLTTPQAKLRIIVKTDAKKGWPKLTKALLTRNV